MPETAEIIPPSVAIPALLVSPKLPSDNILPLLLRLFPLTLRALLSPVASIDPLLVRLPPADTVTLPPPNTVPV